MKKTSARFIWISVGLLCIAKPNNLISWGFLAHQTINKKAILGLPEPLLTFYSEHVQFLSDHAVDPDKRRYIDTSEAPKHYIDAERFGIKYASDLAFWDSLPRKFSLAKEKFGPDFLHANGSVPWQIQKMMYGLIQAFKGGNQHQILQISAEIGHYIADAHVPLHTTENYDGQLTHQKGVHALWETRIPEISIENYLLIPSSAHYLPSPADTIFQFLAEAHQLTPLVLAGEKTISGRIPEHARYEFSPAKESGKPIKSMSFYYVKSYENLMGMMVQIQMQKAIQQVANFWYTAWILAGQPSLPTEENSSNFNANTYSQPSENQTNIDSTNTESSSCSKN